MKVHELAALAAAAQLRIDAVRHDLETGAFGPATSGNPAEKNAALQSALESSQSLLNALADFVRSYPSAAEPPVVVIEHDGGSMQCARSSSPCRVILLDSFIEGGDLENIKSMGDQSYYVSRFQLDAPADPGQSGVDPQFVGLTLQYLS